MTTPTSANASALMGALVADAATLGLHWIYDPERIAEVGGAHPAFTPITAEHYEGVPAYFAHAQRENGDLSQYGEVLLLALRAIRDNTGFDVTAYQDAYAAFFGAGGDYRGYIDRPTRGALSNIETEQRMPSGIDDDQHPALATLPAIVAQYRGADEMHAHVKAAVHVTNVNAAADHYAILFADLLADVLAGTPLHDALQETARKEPLLQSALDSPEVSSTAYGEMTGRACHLHQGMPLSFHILSRSNSYQDAVEANILAGGDNCGRSIIIGSLAGAYYGMKSIPIDWLLNMRCAQDSWRLAKKL